MNRLAFRPVLRTARARTTLTPHKPCTLVRSKAVPATTAPTMRFASTSTTTLMSPPSPEFERMLSSLYPGMEPEDVAKRVAVMYMMTEKKNEIEQVEKRLRSVMRGQDFEPVSERIKHYLKNPPEDLLVSRAPPMSDPWLNPQGQKALSQAGMSAFDYLTILMETDPSVRLIRSLDEVTSENVEHDWVSMKESSSPETLERLLQFYSKNGIDFVPPSAESISAARTLKERSDQDEASLLTEEEAALIDADPVAYAQKAARDATYHRAQLPASNPEFPDLMTPDPLLDPKDVIDFPPTKDSPYHNRVIVYNHRSVFHDYSNPFPEDIEEEVDEFAQQLPVSKAYYKSLHQSILIRRQVVLQTGKGKVRRTAVHVLLGNGDGLVGLGEGKHSNGTIAMKSARIEAVKNLDWVERFEKRTVGTEMRTKLGGTELILRPRPVGFGLRCNPHLHQILRAAGFKDISAKVWGSRNKLNVIKAAFRMLQAGHAPTGMGDGLGGPGKKLSKGAGLVGQDELERARGRKLISLRK